jgi:DNA polymerase-3 subunit alpha (Gram-positive type)
MFPKAHAAAYIMSAIRLGWYKIHYPVEFYAGYFSAAPGGFDGVAAMKGKGGIAACLSEINAKGKDTSQKEDATFNAMQLAGEYLARGFKFLPVDLYKSDAKLFLPEDGKIRLPFGCLPGLGEVAAENIQAAKECGEFLSVEEFKQRTSVSKSVMEILEGNDIFNGLSETNQISFF